MIQVFRIIYVFLFRVTPYEKFEYYNACVLLRKNKFENYKEKR
jgi:hypothetical protein